MLSIDQIRTLLPLDAMWEAPELPFPKIGSGKVRDLYALGSELLIVASDRLSAFDVVLPDGVPGKGILLTQLSLWWFEQTKSVLRNHLVENHEARLDTLCQAYPTLRYRSMLVRRLKPVKLEAVVRGYLAGSAWSEYQKTGQLWDHELPPGLRESEVLPQALLTPTTKAVVGHDRPITASEAKAILGDTCFEAVKQAATHLYHLGAEMASKKGLILADTKFEFGTDEAGELYLIDEVLTPDSSRYWPQAAYSPGKPQLSFDKQYVRDFLETLTWDKTAPGPELPEAVITHTQAKYLEALMRLMV